MPMLAPDKYQTFYLINNGTCDLEGYDFLWDMSITGQGTSDQVNDYTSLKAFQEGNFERVYVRAGHVTNRLYTSGKSVTDERVMEWDDLDQDVVDIVNAYYEKSDYERRVRERQITFAGKVRRLVEGGDLATLTFDERGFPEVEVRGLPYLYDMGRLTDFGFKASGGDYDYDVTVDFGNGELVDFDRLEMRRLIDGSRRYGEITDMIYRFYGFDRCHEYDDD